MFLRVLNVFLILATIKLSKSCQSAKFYQILWNCQKVAKFYEIKTEELSKEKARVLFYTNIG